jgi:hypothetical protein
MKSKRWLVIATYGASLGQKPMSILEAIQS